MTSQIISAELFNDYGAKFPVWTMVRGAGLTIDESIVSDTLRERLREWARAFDCGYDPESGWSNHLECTRHIAQGRELYRELRAELPAEIPLSGRVWEVTVQGKPSGEIVDLSA